MVEQQLENLTQANEDLKTEDDSYLQEHVRFVKDPLNVNAADQSQLEDLIILSPIQISNFLSYRKLLGNFIDIYELQAIPGWDMNLLRRIKPYVTVEARTEMFNTFKSRLSHGNGSLLLRASQVLERSKGYPAGIAAAGRFYEGSPQKI